ncbi:MAG: ABC transporter ATP-binding protein [Cytophagaceae bacterium]|nr:MAG: ABC transporter ATP-binding protein [Cytophagaceae bacterium]
MSAKPAPLKIERLHVNLSHREVLKGLSVEIAKGEVFGLLGSNGAGKTTLIRSICGRVKASAGSISIAGHQGKAALRQIGLVPQELALYSHLTARENLTVFGRLSGLSARDAISAVEWASEAADIKQHLNDRVEILSGGWKRRVNIAAAILHRPALLVLDEPTVGVDVDARNGLHEVISSLSRAGIGVVLATHDLEQAHSTIRKKKFPKALKPKGKAVDGKKAKWPEKSEEEKKAEDDHKKAVVKRLKDEVMKRAEQEFYRYKSLKEGNPWTDQVGKVMFWM